MATNERNNWDHANQQGENLDTNRSNSNRQFHSEDDRHQNRNAKGSERQSELNEDDDKDVTKNDFSESDDSYGHGKEYYSKTYVPGGRSSRDDIPGTDTGA
ncbi:MAG TPA: hypothetical protein VK623_11010 [Flavobacterium sp.]|nr:hypothetical protein [Flavobacterium sp.]